MSDSESEKQALLRQESEGGEPEHTYMCAMANPKHWSHRYLFLILICFLCFGNYFVYDNPAALQPQFIQDMKITTTQFMYMYAVYSWPNVALCFFGGYLMDRVFGVRLGAVMFAGLILLGQVVVAIGAQADNFNVILAGRLIFGLGGENLAVAQNTYAVNWFKGKELNMVFGLQLSFSRLGSTTNMLASVPIYNSFSGGKDSPKALGDTLWVGAFLCGFSFLCAIAAGWIDKRAGRLTGRDKKKADEPGEVIKLSDVLTFPLSFWLVCIICVAFYVTVFPYIALAIVFYQDKFNLTASSAATVNSLVYLISAGASPLFGFMVDKIGRNVMWVFIALIGTYGCHAMLAFSFLNPFIPISLLGVVYSLLACSLWPMVSLMIPEHQLGTAYGFMQAVQNLGLAVIAMVAGTIVDTKGYLWLEVFFLAWLSVAIMCCMLLFVTDHVKEGGLNFSTARRQLKKAQEALEAPVEVTVESSEAPRLRARTPFELRNRLISRIGVPLPSHYEVMKSRVVGPSMLK
eukprot:m.586226 g.586226  ORF g.586226 m.586226 type:complete len:517 (-) comp57975_c0_seq9:2945-4495(-)